MLGILEGQSVRLEVISGKNLKVPSCRIPAGIFVSINIDSKRRWKSAIRVLSSESAVAWGKTLTVSSLAAASPKVSLEIRASFELSRTLGQGELIGTLEISWNELLDHGAESFDLSFPPIRGVSPSLTLKAASVHADGNDDDGPFDSIIDSEIDQHVDAGNTALAEYLTSKRVTHLDNAVEHFQLVLDQCPVDHPDHAAALTNLAWVRLEGYVRKDVQDIKSITALFRDALALYPQDHPDHALYLYHLTRALVWRYRKEGTAVDMDESAQLCNELLSFCPKGTYLRNIGVDSDVYYVICECNRHTIDTTEKGVHLPRIELELYPLGHRHRLSALDKLSRALRIHFQQSGSIDDIDESIQVDREAASLCPEGHPHHDTYLDRLALSLQSRFDHQGKSHDLNESISLFEEVLCLRPVGHKFRDTSLGNLGDALLGRFNQPGDINDIDDINRAVSLGREALILRPHGHPWRGTTLANLAHALNTRYGILHVSEDLNEAIDLYRESLRSDQPMHHKFVCNLSSALCFHFMETRQNEDVEEAINLCQGTLVELPPLHPDRYFSHVALGNAYLSRYRVQNNPVDLSLVVENFRLASSHPTQGFPNRIRTALHWVDEAEQYQHESALEAYHTCLDLFDNHVMTRSLMVSRREAAAAFHGARSLPVDAASCAIRSDNLQRAVELVEQGRSQQWSLASRLRTPLEDLKSTDPDLADKFAELSEHLSDVQDNAVYEDRAAGDQEATRYRKLMAHWEATVTEIRNLCGFSQFLLPPSYTDLQAAARYGPVIILIASKYSCSTIIVPTSGEPHHVRFPRITLPHLEKLKDDFAAATRDAFRMRLGEPRKKLRVVLRIVWDEIMLPIVNVLKHVLKLKHQSRIWLCPTAAFTSIPLHAANPFKMKADHSGKAPCLEDLYICSYTPTLSALIRARQTMEKRATPSFVAIGFQPGGGQGIVLTAVDNELDIVRELVPPQVKFTYISSDDATQAGALEALRCNTWVHLACHGKQDPEQPYNSRFAMRDKPLTLLDIIENNVPQAEFAFLSASHTAAGDERTPDEVIHLAAGLQFSGFKSIIGTLWDFDDTVAKHVIEAFYKNMFKDLEEGDMPDCTKAARALNRATDAVKTKVPLEQRIGFVHIGV